MCSLKTGLGEVNNLTALTPKTGSSQLCHMQLHWDLFHFSEPRINKLPTLTKGHFSLRKPVFKPGAFICNPALMLAVAVISHQHGEDRTEWIALKLLSSYCEAKLCPVLKHVLFWDEGHSYQDNKNQRHKLL